MRSKEYERNIRLALDSLGISIDLIAEKRLLFHPEAQELVVAEMDRNGNAYCLIPGAAKAWRTLQCAAGQDHVTLEIVSAFRSIDDQIEIIRAKLDCAIPMQTILTLSAPPGFSEHHTGCAVDINTPGCVAREEPFEDTEAFAWLMANAGRFGYTLSYPRGNSLGFIYEPWHWFFRDSADYAHDC